MDKPATEERQNELLKWYESRPRIVTPEFISSLPWQKVQYYEISDLFLFLLKYFRDIERFVEKYQKDLLRTPTGRNKYIRRFLERWGAEELGHEEIISKFLAESGLPNEEKWFEKLIKSLPLSYRLQSPLQHTIAVLFNENFTPVHMAWGAIQEYTTLAGYNKMINASDNPVLRKIISAIKQEEAVHAKFYFEMAQLYLENFPFRQKLARFLIEYFWKPVGEGVRSRTDVEKMIKALFAGTSGLQYFDQRVTQHVQKLPGFGNFSKTSQVVTLYVK